MCMITMCSNSTCKSCLFKSSHTNGYVRIICMWNNTWFHSYDCTVVSMTAHAEQSQRKAKLQEYLLCTLLTLGFTKEFDSSNHRKITSYVKPKQRMSMKFSNSFRSLMKHCRNYGDSVNNVFLCESSLNQTLEQWFPTGGSRPQSGSRRSFFGVANSSLNSLLMSRIFRTSVYQNVVATAKPKYGQIFVKFTLSPL